MFPLTLFYYRYYIIGSLSFKACRTLSFIAKRICLNFVVKLRLSFVGGLVVSGVDYMKLSLFSLGYKVSGSNPVSGDLFNTHRTCGLYEIRRGEVV